MKHLSYLLLTFSFALLLACGSNDPSGTADNTQPLPDTVTGAHHFDPEWAANSFWDDGQAEVARYEASRIIYGQDRPHEYVRVTVKEAFNEEFGVKTDNYDRRDLFEVIKVNHFSRVPTQNYPYHYMTSLFVRRDQPTQLVKLVQSSQEWCGQTVKSFTREAGYFRWQYHSYWDGEGTGENQVKSDALFEDQLMHALRALRFETGLTFAARVYPTQENTRARTPRAYDARFSVQPTELPINGELRDAWQVDVQFDTQHNATYWFASSYPNALLRYKHSDGRRMELQQLSRYAYWEQRDASR